MVVGETLAFRARLFVPVSAPFSLGTIGSGILLSSLGNTTLPDAGLCLVSSSGLGASLGLINCGPVTSGESELQCLRNL